MPITTALIPVDTPLKLNANEVYALPSAGTLVTWQSVAGSNLLASIDGIVFGSLGTSAANEPKSMFTAAAYVKTAVANTYIIAKVAPISNLSPPDVGSGGGGGELVAHHITHEEGGTDMITALNAAILTGTINNARLAANVALTDRSNSFSLIQNFNPSIAIGSLPAQSGALRLAKDEYIKARNAANNGDYNVIRLDSGYGIEVSQAGIPTRIVGPLQADGTTLLIGAVTASSSVAIGATPAQSGALRLANNQFIASRNAANSADINVIGLNATNEVAVGAHLMPNAGASFDVGSGSIQWRTGFFSSSLNAPNIIASTAVIIGTNPAQTGALRLANNQFLVARNAANTADVNLIWANTSNQIVVGGELGVDTVAHYASAFNFVASQTFTLSGDAAVMKTGLIPAVSGTIRLSNNQAIKARDPGNLFDITMIATDTTGRIVIGEGTGPSLVQMPGGFEMIERLAPSGNPPVNRVWMYSRDSGTGVTQLVIHFSDGTINILSTAGGPS